MLPVAIATAVSGATPPSEARWAIDPQDAERHDAGAGRRVVADDDAAERAARRGAAPQRVERGPAVAAVDDLDRHVASPTSRSMSAVGHRRRAAVDVADDVRPRLEDASAAIGFEPAIDGPPGVERRRSCRAAWPRRPSARPARPVLTEPEADLADELHAGGGHLGEVVLLEAQLEDRRARVDLDAGRAGGWRTPWRPTIASALSPTMSFGRPGRWTSPAEITVVTPPCSAGLDEVDRPLARREVAEDRVGVRVDEARASRSCRCASMTCVGTVARRARARPPRSGRRRSRIESASASGASMSPVDERADVRDERSHRVAPGRSGPSGARPRRRRPRP